MQAVFADKEVLREAFGGILYGGLTIVCTEQQTDGRVIILLHHLVLVIVQIEVQLRGILVAETVTLQVDDDVTLQDAVVENEVGLVVVLINEDTLLTRLFSTAE